MQEGTEYINSFFWENIVSILIFKFHVGAGIYSYLKKGFLEINTLICWQAKERVSRKEISSRKLFLVLYIAKFARF